MASNSMRLGQERNRDATKAQEYKPLLLSIDQHQQNYDYASTIKALDELLASYPSASAESQCHNAIRWCINNANDVSSAVLSAKLFGIAVGANAPSIFIVLLTKEVLILLKQPKESRRVVALLVIQEVVTRMPVFFIPHITTYLEAIWDCFYDQSNDVRQCAKQSTDIVLGLLANQPKTQQLGQYRVIVKRLESELKIEAKATGTLSFLRLLLRQCRPVLEDVLPFNHLAAMISIRKALSLKNKVTRLALLKTLPFFAEYNTPLFIKTQLSDVVAFVVNDLSCETSFGVAARLIEIVGAIEIAPYLDRILFKVRDTLQKRRGLERPPPVWRALTCLATICRVAPSPAIEAHVKSSISTVFTWGLSDSFIRDMRDIIHTASPSLRATLEDNILDLISMTLSGLPFRQRSGEGSIILENPANSAETATQTKQALLALNALVEFKLTNCELMGDFLRYSVLPFVDSHTIEVRRAAINTISELLIPSGTGEAVSMARSIIVGTVITRLLVVASSDFNLEIRLAIINSFTPVFYPYLANNEFIKFFFTSLSDEAAEVRLVSLQLLCRMVEHNRSHILLALRKQLFDIVHNLRHIEVHEHNQLVECCTMLKTMADIVPDFVADYMPNIAPALERLLPDLPLALLVPYCDTVTALVKGAGPQFAMTGMTEEIINWMLNMLTNLSQSKDTYKHRIACLRVIRCVLRHTGGLGTCYQRFPALLQQITGILANVEEVKEVREEALRIMGVAGALDPHRAAFATESSTENKLPLPVLNEAVSHATAARMVLSALSSILDPNDSRLVTSDADMTKYAFKTLLALCEASCITCEELQLVFPATIDAIMAMGERETTSRIMLFELSTLILYSGYASLRHDDKFKTLFEFVWNNWPDSRPIMIHVISTLAAVSERTGSPGSKNLSYFVPLIVNYYKEFRGSLIPTLNFFLCAGAALQSLTDSVVSTLVSALDRHSTSLEAAALIIGVLVQMTRRITMTEFSSGLIRTICAKIASYYEGNPSSATDDSPLVKRSMALFILLQGQLKAEFLKFVPAIMRVVKMYNIRHNEFTECTHTMRGNPGKKHSLSRDFVEELNRQDAELREIFNTDASNRQKTVWRKREWSSITPLTRVDSKLLTVNEHVVREHALAWKNNVESFGKWLDNFSMTILRESPYVAFRCLSTAGGSLSLADRAPLCVRHVFNLAFRSIWMRSTGALRLALQQTAQGVLRESSVPDDVVLAILSVAEHMDLAGCPLPFSATTLSLIADQKGMSAKALHWMESVCYTSDNPQQCVDALFSLYSKLGYIESSINLLSKANRGEKLTATGLIKLGRYEEALSSLNVGGLDSARDKITKHKRTDSATSDIGTSFSMDGFSQLGRGMRVDTVVSKMLCLNHLGEMHSVAEEWRALHARLKSQRRDEDDEEGNILAEVAPYAADAAVRLHSWDILSEALAFMSPESDTRFYTLSAALEINRKNWDEAHRLVKEGRIKLMDEVGALLQESYTRAYDAILMAQQFVELEETIDCLRLSSSERRSAAMVNLSDIWTQRMTVVANTPHHWKLLLQTRGLLIPERDDIPTRVAFVKLCRQSGATSMERFTLEQLLGARHPTIDDIVKPSHHPKVVLEFIKHLSTAGELYPGGPFGSEKDLLKKLIKVHEGLPERNPVLARMYARVGYSSHGIEAIACFEKATDLDPTWWVAWRNYAESNAKMITANGFNYQHLTESVEGYIQAIKWGPGNSTVIQDVLKLLSLMNRHKERVWSDLAKRLRTVQVRAWQLVLPQLIAMLDIGTDESREIIVSILSDVAYRNPQCVIYPLIVCTSSHESGRRERASEILEGMALQYPELVQQGKMVSNELVRISMVLQEEWHDALENAAKLYFGDRNASAAATILEKMHARTQRPPESIAEVVFIQKYGRLLAEAREWLVSYRKNKERLTDFNCAWQIYHNVYRSIDEAIKTEKCLELQYTSPKLFEASDLCLAVPTLHFGENLVKIAGFDTTLHVIPSKQRPKRIGIRGSDGMTYTFLLKGREDLRLDERVMQLLRLANSMLSYDPTTKTVNGYQVQRYSVTPLWESVGLIGWVNECDTMHELIKQYRTGRRIVPELELQLMNLYICMQHPKAYDVLCSLSKVEVLEYLAEQTSGHDLRKVMWSHSTSSEVWLERRVTYTQSLATMSVVGYILGLGDRHPNNIMIQRSSGRVVHIDFGDCFEVAMTRDKFPERVPFRLTRMLCHAMEIGGEGGMFRGSAEAVMTVLRENIDSVVAMLEAFVQDPLINWRLVNKPGTAPEEVEAVPISERMSAGLQIPLEEGQLTGIVEGITAMGDPADGDDESVYVVPREEDRERSVKGSCNPAPIHDGMSLIARLESKLRGREFSESRRGPQMPPKEQVRRLIAEATDINNVAQSWLGWFPFW